VKTASTHMPMHMPMYCPAAGQRTKQEAQAAAVSAGGSKTLPSLVLPAQLPAKAYHTGQPPPSRDPGCSCTQPLRRPAAPQAAKPRCKPSPAGAAAALTACGHPFSEQEDVTGALVHPHLHGRQGGYTACNTACSRTTCSYFSRYKPTARRGRVKRSFQGGCKQRVLIGAHASNTPHVTYRLPHRLCKTAGRTPPATSCCKTTPTAGTAASRAWLHAGGKARGGGVKSYSGIDKGGRRDVSGLRGRELRTSWQAQQELVAALLDSHTHSLE
jgi:hypothetical protein